MRTYRSADFYRIREPKHNQYYAAGIPWRFWKESPGSPEFKDVMWASGKVKVADQQKWYDKVWEGKLYTKPYLILFASSPTDEVALAHTFQICKRIIRKPKVDGKPRRIQIQVAGPEAESVDKHNEGCEVFVLHNVMAQTDRARVTLVRDWITRNDAAFRLITMAGQPDDFRLCYGVEPHAVFFFNSDKPGTVIRATRSFV